MKIENMKIDSVAKLAYLVENEGYFTAHSIDKKAGLAMTGENGCFIAIHAQALKKLLDKQAGEYFMLAVKFNNNSDTGESKGQERAAQAQEAQNA